MDNIAKKIADKLYGDNEPTKYRIWHIPQVPMKAFYVEVPDRKTAVILTNALANYDEFQYENNIKPDYANAGGIQRWDEVDGEWVDVHDEDDE